MVSGDESSWGTWVRVQQNASTLQLTSRGGDKVLAPKRNSRGGTRLACTGIYRNCCK